MTQCKAGRLNGFVLMVAAAMALLVPADRAAPKSSRPKPVPCPGGRFLVQAPDAPLLTGTAALETDAVVVADPGQVSLGSGCPAVVGKVAAKPRFTQVTVRWPSCGAFRKVRLTATIASPACDLLQGKLRGKKLKANAFTARRSTCGDGVVDADGGEGCEPSLGACPEGLTCTEDCRCAPPGVGMTTTTVTSSTSTTRLTSTTVTTTTTSSTRVIATTSTSTSTTPPSTVMSTTTTTPTGSSTTTTLPTVPGPDPATVATPLDRSASTAFADATSFLYGGSDPVQFNVAPGTIVPRRAAVVRGKVLDRDGTSLTGVLVQVLGHPEFGQTLSRADGMFDLAVNGGGLLTVVYAKSGFLEAQRQIDVPWQDYVGLPDVMLVALDPKATVVDLAAAVPIQVASGTPQTDANGTRQAMLLVQQGTAAQMVMPDGSTHALGTLTIRATEYTVGATGPESMPAVLPPASGYTYAVELSADEAMAAGAAMVAFDKPMFSYVENFLDFPAGTPVPAGYYDRQLGQWIASENGRVIGIVDITGGHADLDVTGDGAADTGSALTDLGITDAERAELARLYLAGQSLWRVPIRHFTPWDYNWPFGPPDDAEAADVPDPRADTPETCPVPATGSLIECENQVLGEAVGIAGTRYGLHYRSDRVPGRVSARTLDLALSGASVPASLLRIDLTVEVAGQMHQRSFAPGANQRTSFVWDGNDAYGRPVRGGQQVRGRIDYVYGVVFQSPSGFGASFGRFGGAVLGNRSRGEVGISRSFVAQLGEANADARGFGLGGWTLGVHHSYDPVALVLRTGDGRRRRAESVGRVIDTVLEAGPTEPGLFPGLAVAPDGSLYFGRADLTLRRLAPDGTESVVAGGGNAGAPDFGDGGPALDAQLLNTPDRFAFGPDGSVYLMDNVVRRIGPDGIIRRVAGRYHFGSCEDIPDGTPAIDAELCLDDIAVGPDGSIYTAELFGPGSLTARIRRIGPDGIITMIAGGGGECEFFSSSSCGDGGPAPASQLFPGNHRIAAGPDGSVYLTDAHRIRRITPHGTIVAFAGQARTSGHGGDGGPAGEALLCNPSGFVVAPDGSIHVADSLNNRLRRIGADGKIATLAGSADACTFGPPIGHSGDRGPALQARMNQPRNVVVAPDGTIYVMACCPFRIRRVGHALPGFSEADIIIPSEDGRELHLFDRNGRHLATLDGLTRAPRFEFGYDAAGRLARVVEKTGGTDNVTTIEHDGAGNPTAIVGPFGQRTTFTVDANGFLARITNPAGEAVKLGSTAGGLLTSLIDPRDGPPTTFAYDDGGRLIRDEDPLDGFQTLARESGDQQVEVARTTALDRTTTYLTEDLPAGIQRRTVTAPDGASATSEQTIDASTTTATAADGTVLTTVLGPDPRFGMEVPVPASVALRFPSGLETALTSTRTATVTDPNDLTTVATQTDTTTVDGRTSTIAYTAADRSIVATSASGRTQTLLLDGLGRVTQFEVPGLDGVSASYDGRGRPAAFTLGSGPSARTTTFAYDAQGFLERLTDPLDRAWRFTYDAAGRVTSLTWPDGRITAVGHDAAGHMTSLTPPGRPAHTFAYDARGALVTVTPPDVPGTGATRYAYDADGLLTTVTRPDGRTITLGYDAGGRLGSTTLATGGVATATYTTRYDAAGRVASRVAPDGFTVAYAYDGDLLTGETVTGPAAGSVTHTYDAALRLASQSVNGGNTVAFEYDADDLLIAVGDLSITRDSENGLGTGSTLGTVSDAWTYDGLGEPATYSASAGSTSLYAVAYTRDAMGRIVDKTETVGGVTTVFAYAYDLADQLTEVRRDGLAVERYEYDANGNRTAATVRGASVTPTYDDQDRLVTYGATTYTYNASGQLETAEAGGRTTRYTYDPLGNLLDVTLPDGTAVTYLVDARGRRVGKRVDGTLVQGFLYGDGLRPVAELDERGDVVGRFVYAWGTTPVYVVKGGVAHRIIRDQVGSVRVVVNAETGAVVQRLDYDAFGNLVLDTNPGFQPFGFAGGLQDRDTGLVRFGRRDYEPASGRWTAKDPIGFAGLDANLYRYARNDPVSLVDPTGLIVPEDFVGGFVNALAVGAIQGAVMVVMWPLAPLVPIVLPLVGFNPGELIVERQSGLEVDPQSGGFVLGNICGAAAEGLVGGGLKGLWDGVLSGLARLTGAGVRGGVHGAVGGATNEVTQVVRPLLQRPSYRPNAPGLEVINAGGKARDPSGDAIAKAFGELP